MKESLEDILGYRFRTPSLVEDVCLHPSVAAPRQRNYAFERLEFLGDRVLGLVVAEQLYRKLPHVSEGVLAHRLTQLVCQSFLVQVADMIGLRHYVRFSGVAPGQEDRILADACEALIGALYQDGGLEVARILIQKFWALGFEQDNPGPKDPKSRLQEWTQARGLGLPHYDMTSHSVVRDECLFEAIVWVEKLNVKGVGRGRSKKAAQSQAAELLLMSLETSDPDVSRQD